MSTVDIFESFFGDCAAEASKPGYAGNSTTAYGLFHWSASGIYRARDCIKSYKTRGGADRAASKLYDADHNSDVVAREYFL